MGGRGDVSVALTAAGPHVSQAPDPDTLRPPGKSEGRTPDEPDLPGRATA
jgi:hypothetical protein